MTSPVRLREPGRLCPPPLPERVREERDRFYAERRRREMRRRRRGHAPVVHGS